MPKVAKSKSSKVSQFVLQYPNEFKHGPKDTLVCKLCLATVACDRKSTVDAHRATKMHTDRKKSSETSQYVQSTLILDKSDMAHKLVSAFLKADIPLHKLRSPAMKDLFESMGCVFPSESTCRRQIEGIYEESRKKITSLFKDRDIFVICDESDVNGTKFLNI